MYMLTMAKFLPCNLTTSLNNHSAEQGQDHRLLLRQPRAGQDAEAQMRGVWFRLQEGGILIVKFSVYNLGQKRHERVIS